MSIIHARLELSAAQTKSLIELLVTSLADNPQGFGNGGYRTGINLVIDEDQTRLGQRNGHRIVMHADGQGVGMYATAYDVLVDGE